MWLAWPRALPRHFATICMLWRERQGAKCGHHAIKGENLLEIARVMGHQRAQLSVLQSCVPRVHGQQDDPRWVFHSRSPFQGRDQVDTSSVHRQFCARLSWLARQSKAPYLAEGPDYGGGRRCYQFALAGKAHSIDRPRNALQADLARLLHCRLELLCSSNM